MRFAGKHELWIKDKTGFTAGPHQVIWMYEISENPNILCVEPPRAGKTTCIEAVCMEELFTNSGETELIFGPKQDQASNALKYQLDWIETNKPLKDFVAMRRGKRRLNDTGYELKNGSRAKTFGILGHFDSEEASIIRGEEWDDMDMEIWINRVIARGGKANRSGLPTRFRLSGTIQKGKGNMFQTENSGNYHVVTKFDFYDLLALGWYDENAIAIARKEMTDDEWLRVYLLKYTEAKNYIWESHLNRCLELADERGWQGIEYKKGGEYRPFGTVYAGFDCGHSGEKKVRSVYRLDLIEMIGETALWLNGFEWEPGTDPTKIKEDVRGIWSFYRPAGGYGDALKSNFIAEINDDLFQHGLINVDRSKFPENTPGQWKEWTFAPMWNTGKAKYIWAEITKTKIENMKFLIPNFISKDDRPMANMARRLRRALLNVRMEVTNASYPSLVIIKKEIGDDPFDALNMAMACANDRQLLPLDFGKIKIADRRLHTADLRDSILGQLHHLGKESDFGDF